MTQPGGDTAGGIIDAVAQLGASFSLHLGQVVQESRQLRAALTRPPAQPTTYRMPLQELVPANGVVVLDFGGPAAGTHWYVRQITVGGSDPTAVPAGVADIYVTSTSAQAIVAAGGLAGLGLADWRDHAGSLPLIAFYGLGDLDVVEGTNLAVVFTGCTPADLVSAVVQVEIHQYAALAQVVQA